MTLRYAFLLLLALSMPREAEAATLTASVSPGLCKDGNSLTHSTTADTISHSCRTAFARAGFGSLGTSITAYMYGTGKAFYSANGYAAANFHDTLYFPGLDSGTLYIPIDVAGTSAISLSGDLGSNYSYAIHMGGSLTGHGALLSSEVVFAMDRVYYHGVPWESYSSGSGRVLTVAEIPFSGGSVILNGGLITTASCTLGSVAGGTVASCLAGLDYSSSLRLLGASVADADGNLREDVLITSDSGFDYRAGVAPHVIAAVPLPASAWLLLAGVGGLPLLRAIPHRSRQRGT